MNVVKNRRLVLFCVVVITLSIIRNHSEAKKTPDVAPPKTVVKLDDRTILTNLASQHRLSSLQSDACRMVQTDSRSGALFRIKSLIERQTDVSSDQSDRLAYLIYQDNVGVTNCNYDDNYNINFSFDTMGK